MRVSGIGSTALVVRATDTNRRNGATQSCLRPCLSGGRSLFANSECHEGRVFWAFRRFRVEATRSVAARSVQEQRRSERTGGKAGVRRWRNRPGPSRPAASRTARRSSRTALQQNGDHHEQHALPSSTDGGLPAADVPGRLCLATNHARATRQRGSKAARRNEPVRTTAGQAHSTGSSASRRSAQRDGTASTWRRKFTEAQQHVHEPPVCPPRSNQPRSNQPSSNHPARISHAGR